MYVDHRRRREGRAGTSPASCIAKGHEVTLIEGDRDRYLTVEEELEHAVQYGDATELWVLERAGIQRADLVDRRDRRRRGQHADLPGRQGEVPAASGSSPASTTRGTSSISSCSASSRRSRATDLILRLIEHEVPQYGLVHLLELEEERLEIIELEVGEGAPAAGQARSATSTLPEGALIISVLPKDGGGRVPKGDTVIEAGDEVMVILDPGLEEDITRQFTRCV